ncbi:hypothetical protein MRB53_020742 [Persea americana]|uniref:Uncharacterized protein n=1 Tax=Persea americana TaxID=3435 RepID=A0ACC2L1Z5_PERAE|nr:hypothetical protein MRB53_020742 [Persea americana]
MVGRGNSLGTKASKEATSHSNKAGLQFPPAESPVSLRSENTPSTSAPTPLSISLLSSNTSWLRFSSLHEMLGGTTRSR